MKVFRLQGGGTRYEGKRFVFRFVIFKVHQLLNQNVLSLGSVLNVEQDINGIVNELPNMPKDIPCFVVRRGRNQDSVNNYKEFIINRADIIAWLRFLHKHNRYYQDIDIDAAIQRCNDSLPENGSIASSLSSIEETDLDQVIESIRNTDSDDANEDGDDDDVDDEGDGINRPETGGASGVDTAPSVSNEYLRLPINPTSAEREQHENLLKEFHNSSTRGRSDSVSNPTRPEHFEWPL